MTNNDMRMELAQAIDAGERALSSLRDARQRLDSAGNWGLFDMLGGGTFTSLVKHAKLGDASDCMEQARRDMEAFMGAKVYLETWVKVKENWRDNPAAIQNFGYTED